MPSNRTIKWGGAAILLLILVNIASYFYYNWGLITVKVHDAPSRQGHPEHRMAGLGEDLYESPGRYESHHVGRSRPTRGSDGNSLGQRWRPP